MNELQSDQSQQAQADAPAKLWADFKPSAAEHEALLAFSEQINDAQHAEMSDFLFALDKKPFTSFAALMAELDAKYPLTSAPGCEPTRVPLPPAPPLSADVPKPLAPAPTPENAPEIEAPTDAPHEESAPETNLPGDASPSSEPPATSPTPPGDHAPQSPSADAPAVEASAPSPSPAPDAPAAS